MNQLPVGVGHMRRGLRITVFVFTVSLGISSCTPGPLPEESQEPVVIDQNEVRLCGTVISRGRNVPVIYDVVKGLVRPIEGTSSTGLIYLRFTQDCATGAHYQIAPADSAEISQEVTGPAGTALGIVINPTKKDFTVIATTSSGTKTSVEIRLTSVPASSPRPEATRPKRSSR